MGIWHLTFESAGRHALFTGESTLLEGVHSIARGAADRVVLFGIVDDHVHVVARTETPGTLRCGLLRALRAVAEVEVLPAYPREVTSRRHLEWLANRYILQQPSKHGLDVHPALWPGSCFVDLIGARRIEGLSLLLHQVLPRYRLRTAFEAVGLEARPLDVLDAQALRLLGARRMVDASARAMGITSASPRTRLATRARRVAAVLCQEVGVPSRLLADELGCRVGSITRLGGHGCDPRDRRATLRRLALETRVHALTRSGQGRT